MNDLKWRAHLRRSTWLLLLFTVAGVVGVVIYGGGARAVVRQIAALPVVFVVTALGAIAIEWLSDAARYLALSRALGVTGDFRLWLRVALVNLFAAYTANLGAPVSAFVIARRGVEPGRALALTVAKQAFFFPAALGPVWIFMLLHPELEWPAAMRLTIWGIGIFSLAVLALLVVLAFSPGPIAKLAEREGRLAGALRGFLDGNRALFRRPSILAASLGLALINQTALAAISVALLQGLGARGPLWLNSFLLTSVFEMAPTPGGAGIEFAGAWLLKPMLGVEQIAAYLTLWRFLSCQLPIVVGGVMLADSMRR